MEGNYYQIETGELVYGTPPAAFQPSGAISYTYAQWERIDGRWTEITANFSSEPELAPHAWLAERSPPLVPYIELWEAALPREAVNRQDL